LALSNKWRGDSRQGRGEGFPHLSPLPSRERIVGNSGRGRGEGYPHQSSFASLRTSLTSRQGRGDMFVVRLFRVVPEAKASHYVGQGQSPAQGHPHVPCQIRCGWGRGSPSRHPHPGPLPSRERIVGNSGRGRGEGHPHLSPLPSRERMVGNSGRGRGWSGSSGKGEEVHSAGPWLQG